VPYPSASAVVIHYEEALYQVDAPLPLPVASRTSNSSKKSSKFVEKTFWDILADRHRQSENTATANLGSHSNSAQNGG